jgi:hypothetical protein
VTSCNSSPIPTNFEVMARLCWAVKRSISLQSAEPSTPRSRVRCWHLLSQGALVAATAVQRDVLRPPSHFLLSSVF